MAYLRWVLLFGSGKVGSKRKEEKYPFWIRKEGTYPYREEKRVGFISL